MTIPGVFSVPEKVIAEEVIIANPNVDIDGLPRNALRAIFGMRLRAWPNNKAIRVFVLEDNDQVHTRFAKKNLSIYPHQLRRAWDRLVYSGTGQAPTEVGSEEEMRAAVASTPGAIGYLSKEQVDDSVRVLEVR
jgi:ABC-type phosphate transport system substrate-binding protein